MISSAVCNSNQWAGTLRSVGGCIPIISYAIVGAIDVAEWLYENLEDAYQSGEDYIKQKAQAVADSVTAS